LFGGKLQLGFGFNGAYVLRIPPPGSARSDAGFEALPRLKARRHTGNAEHRRIRVNTRPGECGAPSGDWPAFEACRRILSLWIQEEPSVVEQVRYIKG
jgi:hypothetical protein